MKRFIRTLVILTVIITAGILLGKPAIEGWMMSVPETAFDDTPLPAAPDYSQTRYWAALPDHADSADWVPHNSGYTNEQATAAADVFFVYPTAAFYGDYWVAGFDNWLHRLAVDFGILPQHASAFNAAGRVYAPRYRSVRMPIWFSEDRDSVTKATDIAYQDVKRAFEHYLQHDNNGRPIMIVSHSQGTLHTIRLLREFFEGQPLQEKLIAAYLIGNTIPDVPWFTQIPICSSPGQTGCYATWNTMIDGGDPHHWVGEKGLEKIDCVNPLSWKTDTVAVDKAENPGSIPMMDYNALLQRLPPMQEQVVGARCGEEGMLWITEKPQVPGYTAALFPGGSYHTYDINFYYASIRDNALLRTANYLAKP